MADPLTLALQRCSLHALLVCVSKALARSGFGDVQILDRRSSGQKSRFGGHELLCEATAGDRPLRVIVKVVLQPARTRMGDELAGAVLRNRADIGLLVTPFKVSARLLAAQAGYFPARIELLDGDALAELMRRSGVGVRAGGSVDYAFFAQLEEVSLKILDFVGKELR